MYSIVGKQSRRERVDRKNKKENLCTRAYSDTGIGEEVLWEPMLCSKESLLLEDSEEVMDSDDKDLPGGT